MIMLASQHHHYIKNVGKSTPHNPTSGRGGSTKPLMSPPGEQASLPPTLGPSPCHTSVCAIWVATPKCSGLGGIVGIRIACHLIINQSINQLALAMEGSILKSNSALIDTCARDTHISSCSSCSTIASLF